MRHVAAWMLCLVSLTSCTAISSDYVITDAHAILPAWDEHGRPMRGWVAIREDYLRKIMRDLSWCSDHVHRERIAQSGM